MQWSETRTASRKLGTVTVTRCAVAALAAEVRRMHSRIEGLRGALKSAAGRAYEVAELRLGDDCMEGWRHGAAAHGSNAEVKRVPVRRPLDCRVRRGFMARPEKQFESATVEWATPADIFEPLAKEFTFVLDVAANAENAKCSEFITREQNGLLSPWRGVCWCNPPYGRDLSKWVRKAVWETWNGVTTVMLIPVRSNTAWWHDLCIPFPERYGLPAICQKFIRWDEGLGLWQS